VIAIRDEIILGGKITCVAGADLLGGLLKVNLASYSTPGCLRLDEPSA